MVLVEARLTRLHVWDTTSHAYLPDVVTNFPFERTLPTPYSIQVRKWSELG